MVDIISAVIHISMCRDQLLLMTLLCSQACSTYDQQGAAQGLKTEQVPSNDIYDS